MRSKDRIIGMQKQTIQNLEALLQAQPPPRTCEPLILLHKSESMKQLQSVREFMKSIKQMKREVKRQSIDIRRRAAEMN